MRLELACQALQRGSCLELFYEEHNRCLEVHAVGLGFDDRPLVLGWEVRTGAEPEHWVVLPLDEPTAVDVSGWWSEAPRPGFVRDDRRFARILCQI